MAACLHATSPIDIDSTKAAGKCEHKCDLACQFPVSATCTAIHRGDHLSFSYEPMNTEATPVTYNGANYSVREVRLFAPSIHTFVGTKASAELVIALVSSSGGPLLLICIPIQEGANSDGGLLSTFIRAVSRHSPAEGDRTTIHPKQSYTLDAFIPRKPFYVYSGTEPFQPCSQSAEIIVFAPEDRATISVNKAAIATLKQLLSAHPYKTVDAVGGKAVAFFHSMASPRTQIGNGMGDGIYIDCQPVDQSTDEVTVTSGSDDSSSGGMTISWDSLIKNPLFIFVLVGIGFVILMAIGKLIEFVVKDKTTATSSTVKSGGAVKSGGSGAKWRKK